MNFILLLLTLGIFDTCDQCQLKDGKYVVTYDEGFNMENLYFVEGHLLTVLNSKFHPVYPVKWISDNQFQLIGIETKSEKTELINRLNSLGTPYYELSDCGNNTVHFKLMRNAHITIGSGNFVLQP